MNRIAIRLKKQAGVFQGTQEEFDATLEGLMNVYQSINQLADQAGQLYDKISPIKTALAQTVYQDLTKELAGIQGKAQDLSSSLLSFSDTVGNAHTELENSAIEVPQ